MFKHRTVVLFLTVALVFSLSVSATALVHEHDYDWPQDLGGREFQFSFWWRGITPFHPPGELAEAHSTDYGSWYDPDPRLEAHIEEVEEWFNCSIEFIGPINEHEAVDEILTQFISGDVQFDYASLTRRYLLDLHAEGLVKPLDEVLVEDYIEAIPERWRLLYRPPLSADRMFGTSYLFDKKGYSLEETGIIWNKEIFEREGLPTPYELWDADEWSIDTLTELAVELTQDTTGDGEIDQWGLGGLGGHTMYLNNLLVANEGALVKEREGVRVATLHEEEAVWMFEWFVELREELDVVGGHWTDGSAAMHIIWFNSMSFPGNRSAADEHGYTYGFVPFPQGPDAPYHRIPSYNIWLGIMPIIEQNPRAVAEVTTALHKYKYPYIEPGRSREEQLEIWDERFWEDWERIVWDRRTVDYLRYMTPRVVYSDHLQAAIQLGFWDAIDDIMDGRSVSATMHELKPALQTWVDEMYDQ